MRLRSRVLIGALTCVSLAAAGSALASACNNLFGSRCWIDLSTGVHMSYFELGSPGGETLILLHTDTTSAVEWAWTVNEILRRDPQLHVLALDQRGAGASDLPHTPTCWSTPNLCIGEAERAADLLAFMDAKKIAKATLVGHAWGAGPVRNVALHHPARVVRLILTGTGLRAADERAVSKPAPSPTRATPWASMEPLGWRRMLEAKGVSWPQGALHMRPIDIDADAVRNLVRNWDISVIASPEVVETIAAQSAAEWLAGWGTLDATPMPSEGPEHMERLAVPTLVLWGSEDFYLTRASQERLIAVLRQASQMHQGMYFYWKQYGVRPPPRSGDKHQADDIGHNLSWEAPTQLAADIVSFVRSGAPTPDRYRSDAPSAIRRILVEPGRATIVSSRPF